MRPVAGLFLLVCCLTPFDRAAAGDPLSSANAAYARGDFVAGRQPTVAACLSWKRTRPKPFSVICSRMASRCTPQVYVTAADLYNPGC